MNRPFPSGRATYSESNGVKDNGECVTCYKPVFGENTCECSERDAEGNWHSIGRKDDSEKIQWHLLPVEETEDVIRVLMFGCKKYAAFNWMKVDGGEERYRNAASRHIAKINLGEQVDPETKLSHYAHAICSLLFALWHSRNERRKS